MRVYPSRRDKVAYSKKYKHGSQMTSHELKQLELAYLDIPRDKLPFLMREHSNTENVRDRLGHITNVYFNERDGWLWADAEIFPHKKEEVKAFINSGRGAEVSLSYEVSKKLIKLKEISCVGSGDFKGASIVVCHSADKRKGGEVIIPLKNCAPFPISVLRRMADESNNRNEDRRLSDDDDATLEDDSDNDEEQQSSSSRISDQIVRLNSGAYVVASDALVEKARAYLQSTGVVDPEIHVEDVSALDNLGEDQRRAMIASMIHTSRISHSSAQAENAEREREAETQRLRAAAETTRRILPSDISNLSPKFIEGLGSAISNTPSARAVAEVAEQTVLQERAHSKTLSSANKKLMRENKTLVERLRILGGAPMSSTVSHSSSSALRAKRPAYGTEQTSQIPNFMDFFRNADLQKPSSSSSSSSSSLRQQKGRETAKRTSREAPSKGRMPSSSAASSSSKEFFSHSSSSSTGTEEEMDLYDRFTWNGMSLYPDPNEEDTFQVVSHSSDTRVATVADSVAEMKDIHPLKVTRDLLLAIQDGSRDVGCVPRDLFSDNIGRHSPQLLTSILYATNAGAVETNGMLGLRGLSQLGTPHKTDSCGFMPRLSTSPRHKKWHIRRKGFDIERAVSTKFFT